MNGYRKFDVAAALARIRGSGTRGAEAADPAEVGELASSRPTTSAASATSAAGNAASGIGVAFDPERAAIIEVDAGVPRAWAEGYALLHPDKPPADVPPGRWRRFLDDIGHFLDGGWAERAAALGWGPLELFGADADRPFARVDRAGLLWLLNGGQLVALAPDCAVIVTPSGARQTFHRRRGQPGRVLAWELSGTPVGESGA